MSRLATIFRLVRHSLADDAVVKALEGYPRGGNDRAGLVFHGAEDAALDGLRLGAAAESWQDK